MGPCCLGAVGSGNRNAILARGPHGTGGAHDIGTEFITQVVKESQCVWCSHAKSRKGLIKARVGHRGHQGVGPAQLHQQAERQGVPKAAFN